MNDLSNIKTYSPEYTNGEFGLNFSSNQPISTAVQQTNEAKAIAETQAQFVIAKKVPKK
jgi:hypothetical protein